MACIACVCHSRQVQQNYTHLLFSGRDVFATVQQSLFGRRNPVALSLQKEISTSLVFACQSVLLSVLLYAMFVMLYTSAASFDLFYKMCFFLFVNQRTLEAFLLLYSSWFKQAHFKCSLTAQTVWKDLWDKQAFACRACESVHSKQPKIWGAQSCACKLSHLICMQPCSCVKLASLAAYK